mmetsp:Transcript_37791/g.86171  ORF Transcript_37791/g.86171 Transcript_37791/m.86171 type:complete len:208 (+) Transcript_37791:140-763(+)
MVDDPRDADHGKAAVLDLLEGHGLDVLLAHAEGVEHEVTRCARATVEGLEKRRHGHQLEEPHPEDDLVHGEGLLVASVRLGDELVVRADHLRVADHLRHTGKLVQVLDDGAGGREHGHASVLDLSLAEELHVAEGGDAKGIEPDVANEGAVKLGGLVEEGHRRRLRLHLGAASHGATRERGKGGRRERRRAAHHGADESNLRVHCER